MDVRELREQLLHLQREIAQIQCHSYESFVSSCTLLAELQAKLAGLLEDFQKATFTSQGDAGAGESLPQAERMPPLTEVTPPMGKARPQRKGRDPWSQQHMAELASMNATLQADIMVSKSTEAQLRAALHEKEALLKEIHHRVKNNMQIVSSLLTLHSESITDVRTITMLKESQRRIRSMALVHQQLYQSEDLGAINAADYIQKLIDDLKHAYGIDSGRIKVKLNVPPILWRTDIAIPCGLILTELLSNACKHAFPDGRTGEIYVALSTDSRGSMTICIRDNGVGLPREMNGHKNESLGLQLVNLLTEQLDGMLQCETHGGTSISITFPASLSPGRA